MTDSPITLTVIKALRVSPCGHMRRAIVDGTGHDPRTFNNGVDLGDGETVKVLEVFENVTDCGPGAMGVTVYSPTGWPN